MSTPTEDQGRLAALKLLVGLAEGYMALAKATVTDPQIDEALGFKAIAVVNEMIHETETALKHPGALMAMVQWVSHMHNVPIHVHKPNERLFLDVSTMHLQPYTVDAVCKIAGGDEALNKFTGLVVDPHGKDCEYGVWVHVPEKNPKMMPVDLAIVIDYARKRGVDWICIDRDAEVLEDLPSYDAEWDVVAKQAAE